MKAALALARSRGVTVRFADLGDWLEDELRSEYDPAIPEIRLNVRLAADLTIDELDELVTLAIGHELYHYCEATGEIARLPNRSARESAAENFARALLERTP
ncbi:MAG TPA: hypothetical protein VFE35_08075 [Candidatus Cybelea sp.]|nr:hypothetical protein [Candidatus Cybelea sp.]